MEKEWSCSVGGWLPGRGCSEQQFEGADRLVLGCLSNWVSVSLLQRKGMDRRHSKVSVCPRIPLLQHTNLSLCKMVVIAVMGLSIVAARLGKAECVASRAV